MNLIMNLASLFASIIQSAKPACTTIIYPSRGKAVLVHDGLSIRHERRWYQPLDPLTEKEAGTPVDFMQDHSGWADPVNQNQASAFLSKDFEHLEICEINPATGLHMLDGGIDVMGNPYGLDLMSSSQSFGHDMGDFGGGFSAFSID